MTKKAVALLVPSSILALSRPRLLSNMVGQTTVVNAIRAHMDKRPPRTWLFTGSPGSGKTTIARIMSVALQCEHMTLWGDPCVACRKQRDSYAIHEINASKVSGVEELEKVAALSMSRPMTGLKRVIILDEVQNISKTAWSMMLNPMEHPPDFTVWILCTSEPAKVPIANKRRCVTYQMKALSIDGAEKFLRTQAAKAAIERDVADLVDVVSTMGISAPGLLLQALEKYAAGGTAAEAVASADSGIDGFKVCKAVTAGDWHQVKSYLKDLKADDVRYLRAVVAGWIRGNLIRETNVARCDIASQAILDLTAIPYDDSMLPHWMIAQLYRITKRYGGR